MRFHRIFIGLTTSAALAASTGMLGLSAAEAATSWSTPVVVNTGTGAVNAAPQLLANVDATELLVGYPFNDGANQQLRVNRSTDGGETWSAPIGVSIATGNANDVKLAASRDLTHISAVWSDSNVLYVASSRDSGTTWSAAHVISNGSLPSEPDIAVSADGTHGYVVWRSSESPGVIRMATSRDSGVSWTAPANTQQLSNVGVDSDFPHVATSGDGAKVAVTWLDATGALVQFDYSSNSGTTWTAPSAAYQINTAGQNVSEALVATNDAGTSVVVAWYDATSHALFTRTTNDGSNWVSSQISAATNVQISFGKLQLVMSSSSQTTYLVWKSNFVAPLTTTVTSSTDAGLSWRNTTSLGPTINLDSPFIAASSNGAIAEVVWSEGDPTAASGVIKTSRTLDFGVNWSTAESITTQESMQPTVAVAGDGSWSAASFMNQTASKLFVSRLAPAPTVSEVAPASGYITGGESITITGTGFKSGATVLVGSESATSVTVVNDTSITAVTPSADASSAVSVTVTNVDGQSGTLANGFTYSNLKTQAPIKKLKLAKRITPKKWVKLVKVPVKMNTGLTATTVVTPSLIVKPMAKVTKKVFKTKRKGGYVQVWSSGKKRLRVVLAISSPATGEYAAYSYSKSYKLKKK